ncbi:MFS transporter [Fusarium agapanthi]|uniref:MFS transporter n=1 Tax=Fusarium agapanthi TaxID=1803897 RepID=A0A9P5EAH0_9HYPO|nr:MFS transporter [Fusarium agapanthi]
MALQIDREAVPGTEQLIDVNQKLENGDHVGQCDIVLIPSQQAVEAIRSAFSYGENTLGAAWTIVSKDTGVSLTNINGGSALNYLLLGFVNIYLGLISGGSMSDTVGWRWSQNIRPFFLWGFPNVVIAAFIYAFRATAGIVSFNTISEILTEPPYNFSTTHTGLIFFAALVGDIIGWGIGVLSDQVVITLARRNGGIKEPEMRLYMLVPCFVLATVGYMLYGWGAQTEAHWITIVIGIGAMISHQVGACTIATAYAMDCFPGISGELVVVLAMCSSMVNFAISYSVQPFIKAAGYGWTMTCFGIMVLLSVLAAIFLVLFGKRWRIAKGPRYYKFLDEVGGYTD